MQKFEKLIIWNKSLILIQSVYDLCKKLPASEKGNIVDQIKRATVSISLNIAEGSGSENDKEFKRFLHIAKNRYLKLLRH